MAKASEEEKSVIEQFLIPFTHLEKRFPLFPGKKSEVAEALLMGISLDELKLFRANYNENAKQAALELLKEDGIVDLLDELPFDGEETIVVLGDSVTEDAQGWFKILEHLLTINTAKPNFKFINSSVGHSTTTDALRRLDRDVLLHEPDWVFVALGTFDAQRVNVAPDRTITALSETWENFETIQNVISDSVENPIIWITPTPLINEMLDKNPLYEFAISEKDLSLVRQLVAGKNGVIIDSLGKRMGGKKPDAWNFISDGLHHSLSGHSNTVIELIRKLAEYKSV